MTYQETRHLIDQWHHRDINGVKLMAAVIRYRMERYEEDFDPAAEIRDVEHREESHIPQRDSQELC